MFTNVFPIVVLRELHVYTGKGEKHAGNAGNDRRRVEIDLHSLNNMAEKMRWQSLWQFYCRF